LSPEYIIIGMIVGYLSGMLGIGGSAITTPILKLVFNVPDLIAIATPLPVIIPTAVSGMFGYKRIFSPRIALLSIISGLPATVLGAFVTEHINSTYLLVLTGFFIVLTGIKLLSKKKQIPLKADKRLTDLYTILIGFFSGFISGLLAIGGGIMLIPGYIFILGLEVQQAISISLLCIGFFAIPGTLVHWYLGHIDWNIAFNLSLGVIPASYFGAKTALKFKAEIIKIIFSLFLIIFGIFFMLNQLIY